MAKDNYQIAVVYWLFVVGAGKNETFFAEMSKIHV